MKKMFLSLLGMVALAASAQTVNQVNDPVEWINPLMGTQSDYALSTGNTYPAVALPWGMNFWAPQTGKMGDGWFYTYNATKIRGFKETHQPSPWINDYGQFVLMPVTGSLKFRQDDRASWFSHKAEVSKPYYYSVYLAEHDVVTEITPTERAAGFRFTFPETDSSFIVIDALDKGSYIKVIPEENKIIGYSTKNSGGVPSNFKDYFVIVFDKPFTSTSTFSDTVLTRGGKEVNAPHAGAVIGFKTHKGEQVYARVASSFISPDQALLNLKEIGNDNFDTVKSKAKAAWNKELLRVKAEGGTADQTATFYSCLYRAMLFPRKFYEIDAAGKVVHYSPYNGKVLPGYMFTDNGFWDTFRAVFPLLNLLNPTLNGHIMEGLANAYKESGFLPEWASPGHRDCMVGSNSASLIADAYLLGGRNFDINTLWDAVVHSSENEGPLSSVGRLGCKYYNTLGYVPYDAGINENAARTLEYAYDDWTIYKLAVALKRPQAYIDLYKKRSQNYRNLFDPETKLMRGKNRDGKFQTPFNPFKWGDAFTEGNSWHYTWSVFHDIKGLMGLMGGRTQFVGMLDSVFKMPPVYDDSYYGGVIHEIREMQIMNMGQYAHGNQPIQHMIYLYNYAGEPWKTQYWSREVMNRLYAAHPDGYCGDEDNGQTSAWYVFSAMGFYPVCPGSGQYVLGAPLFKRMTITLENGKKVIVNAPENNEANRYISDLKYNGAAYTKNYLTHDALQSGAVIDVKMSATPNKQRGNKVTDYPYSFSDELK
ncbi:alpha-1,2-mannosidase, putative [Chitinophaga costaii]|uniref:Alpha-1,2-mannosidase, putative n=1 Tax=Chitinophaga costaii TaxID=1335309 RepID=A0A1C4CAA7_9BACT|nr:GH92 family glycosyl hydrolase [Chitinophaga costaii]PUZ27171.1 glycoside hydrolase family 92 protein [Chitinophaga costaii]SCC15988.1 alpha-1,2-mannosidase, putative [Chitinophaga costaii]